MITFDTDAEPVVAVATPGTTIIDAQAWVREHDTPLLCPDGGVQFVLVYKDQSGKVVLTNFWRITAPTQAVEFARRYLTNNVL
jgi:hypothetical protein